MSEQKFCGQTDRHTEGRKDGRTDGRTDIFRKRFFSSWLRIYTCPYLSRLFPIFRPLMYKVSIPFFPFLEIGIKNFKFKVSSLLIFLHKLRALCYMLFRQRKWRLHFAENAPLRFFCSHSAKWSKYWENQLMSVIFVFVLLCVI